MQRQLSSDQTILVKFIFPGLCIPLLGVVAVAVFIRSDAELLSPSRWIFLFFWVAGSALIWFSSANLKYVSVDDDFLYVSNYFKETVIPLSDIYDVTENIWFNHHPVTIHFKSPSEFGDKIVFMPKTRLWVYTSHPVVKELKQLARSHQ